MEIKLETNYTLGEIVKCFDDNYMITSFKFNIGLNSAPTLLYQLDGEIYVTERVIDHYTKEHENVE